MNSCLFCKMSSGEIPVEKVYEDEYAFIIRDINPQAPYHLLAIPRKHYASIQEIPAEELSEYMGHLMNAVTKGLRKTGLDNKGYRLIINSGEIAGQSIPHIHIHILGGRSMAWPPG